MVEANDLGASRLVGEVATNRVANILPKVLGGITLREDGCAHRMSGKTAIGILFDDEDNLGAHTSIIAGRTVSPRHRRRPGHERHARTP